MSTTTNTIRTGLVAILAATVLSACGSETSPGASPTAPDTAFITGSLATRDDLPSGPDRVITPAVSASSEIPWDEVGPGWFVLGFDPEKADAENSWDEWVLGSGETWVVSPTGEVFEGVRPSPEVREIGFWRGSEVWFGLPIVPYPDDDDVCSIFSCMDTVAVDMRTGATRDALVSPVWPRNVEVTAEGSILTSTDCCDFTLSTVVGPDGADTSFSLAVTLMYPLLAPDGTSLVWVDLESEDSTTSIVKTFFDGREEVLASLPKEAQLEGWIDDTTALVKAYTLTEDYIVVDEEWLALDIESGLTAAWIPPVDEFDFFIPLTIGTWLFWLPDSVNPVVISNDGAIRTRLECSGTSCDQYVSGETLLWVESWEPEADGSQDSAVGGRQRVTLVNLTTGAQKVIFDAPESVGRIIDIQAHARIYE